MKYKRITVDPNQMGGMPCIRHLRIPAATVTILCRMLTMRRFFSEPHWRNAYSFQRIPI
jgi:hypothetical protein